MRVRFMAFVEKINQRYQFSHFCREDEWDPAVNRQIVTLFWREQGGISSSPGETVGVISDLPVKASVFPVFPPCHSIIAHRPEKTGEWTPVLKKRPDHCFEMLPFIVVLSGHTCCSPFDGRSVAGTPVCLFSGISGEENGDY